MGRYEDLLDIKKVEIVHLSWEEEVSVHNNIYIPVDYETEDGERIFEDGEGGATIYNLTREYEITKNGLRRWWTGKSILLSGWQGIRSGICG